MKNILITGGTGFIGKALTEHLLSNGHSIYILSRTASLRSGREHCCYLQSLNDIPKDTDIHIVINLAGEPLNSRRWDDKQKALIVSSRVEMTEQLYAWLETEKRCIELLINGSAIGWYGHQSKQTALDETSPAAPGFSHQLCKAWEEAAEKISIYAARVVYLRIGIVLERDGGPLKELLLPFRLGLGGKLGTGEQGWSWIHRQDLIRLISHIINDNEIRGVINATAPQPVSQLLLAKTLARTLKRACIIPMPAFIAWLLFGDFAEEILLKGQYVYPKKVLESGFTFNYPTLTEALNTIIHKADTQ